MAEKKERRVEGSEAQKRLDEWKKRLKDMEERLKRQGSQVKEGYSKTLEEIKVQIDKAQNQLSALKEKGGAAWKEGMESLNNALDRIEKGFDALKLQTKRRVETTKEELLKYKKLVKESHLWERLEQGFDEAWEFSKKAAHRVSKEIGRATKKAKLTMENHRIQGQITKVLAQIGSEVYTKVVKEGKRSFVPTAATKDLLTKVKGLEEELERIAEALKKEEGD